MDPSCPDNPDLVAQREQATEALLSEPHNPMRYLQRGKTHFQLGFPDLAAADAYKALTLFEYVVDPEGCEYVAKKKCSSAITTVNGCERTGEAGLTNSDDDSNTLEDARSDIPEDTEEDISWDDYEQNIGDVYILLAESLIHCGCIKDAYTFCVQGLGLPHGTKKTETIRVLSELINLIKRSFENQQQFTNKPVGYGSGDDFDASRLRVQGHARRIVYPWNVYEPDRKSPQTVEVLNKILLKLAPRCEVRAAELPALRDLENEAENGTKDDVSIQLGLFAKEDIAPGEAILEETSMLTATNRLHDDICDACNGPLPQEATETLPIVCEDCSDTVFCSQECYTHACQSYHTAVCGQEGLESIGKDISDPEIRADNLHLLLLARSMAMAATQDIHPLDLLEVKYIWGDFHDFDNEVEVPVASVTTKDMSDLPIKPKSATLPFSFQMNIVQPMRILEEMGIDPFEEIERYDTWVLNTLYSKFYGTASGRISRWDGGPEVCAVHPFWCLANHSCDPNVRWDWASKIIFVARNEGERVQWGTDEEKDQKTKNRASGVAIKKDEEILNHYCDLELPVKERRGWMMRTLGGPCQCPRCVWEAAEISSS